MEPLVIVLAAIGLAEPDNVEPVPSPPLAVMRRSEQPRDGLVVTSL